MPLGDDFMDRLAVLNDQARRIPTAESEILVDFRRVAETFTLAHDTPTTDTRAARLTDYKVTGGGTPADEEIIVGEWYIKSDVVLLESGDRLLLEDGSPLYLA